MQYPELTPARSYDKGMGEAVANRSVNRKIERPCPRYKEPITLPRKDDVALDDEVAAYCKSNNLVIDGYHVDKGDDKNVEITLSVVAKVEIEKWEDVAHRVALGNSMLIRLNAETASEYIDGSAHEDREYKAMHHHLRQASILMSGRHLQHGDATQITRNMEVFTNCSTSAMSSLEFYLLLNGSGVGRCYDDEMMIVDWRKMPTVVCVVDASHADVKSGEINEMSVRDARHLYDHATIHEFRVPDSREGWAQAIEKLETMTFSGRYHDDVLLLDFSDVRCKGSPIGGMQDRPASGPGPLIAAINKVAKLRGSNMLPWRATMYADHYFAECVLVGGARRAARMATKFWLDETIFGFIELKRGGFLWSSNNSVMVDNEFWELVQLPRPTDDMFADHDKLAKWSHAHKVFDAIVHAAYHDKTGEPGIITVERLTWNGEGTEVLLDGEFANSFKYTLSSEAKRLLRALASVWSKMKYKVITNPCGEIVLNLLGAYCVIADVVPFHASIGVIDKLRTAYRDITVTNYADVYHELTDEWDRDAEDAFRVATRALIRTNLMDSMYSKEVARTNRIGVGMTGIHEYAWARFGFGWKDLVDEEVSKVFWLTLSRFKRAVQEEAFKYAIALGVVVPHTDTTVKPAGTTSKLFGLTEGAHLATMREYLRWVQFRNDDPKVEEYRALGYPIMKLKSYSGTTVVGFPTVPTICSLGMGDLLVTAAEATPEEQYQWLRLLEKYWIVGVQEDGVTPLRDTGNQVSYTLKYDPKVVDFETFKRTFREGQSGIRCCSVMPQEDDGSAYEYLPEEPLTKARFEQISAAIKESSILEDVGMEHVDCSSGSCPISFGANVAA